MRLLSQAALCLVLLSIPGWSDVLYTNGPVMGTDSGTGYDLPNASNLPDGSPCTSPVVSPCGVFDTFTISADSTVTGVSNIGLWVNTGDTPDSLSWYICEFECINASGVPQGDVLDSGSNVSLSFGAPLQTDVQSQYDIYSVGFSVTDDLDLPAGTYTLELYNAIDATCSTCSVLWDVNNGTGGTGPSTAYVTFFGNSTDASNSFEIDGTAGSAPPAPEPGTWLTLGIGLAGLAAFLWRRHSPKQSTGQTA